MNIFNKYDTALFVLPFYVYLSITKKLCYRKDDRAMRPIGLHTLKIFGTPDYAHGYYSQHFSWAYVRIDPMNVPTIFEVRSFTRS